MARKKRKRRYSRSAGNDVKKEMRRYKRGTAKSGPRRQGRQGEEPEAGHRHRPLEGEKEGQKGAAQKALEHFPDGLRA